MSFLLRVTTGTPLGALALAHQTINSEFRAPKDNFSCLYSFNTTYLHDFLSPSGAHAVFARRFNDKIPLLHLKRKVSTNWEHSSNLTSVYLNILHEIATSGITFKGKNLNAL
ncbi:hypothetical protein M413DRAFT_32757 [Hebeloma cylindrosporum]|uniref:Uncharacterized protein n=1 Tax=Hebeloma cylindrosporum TaxID=76867 RepID=A0A0C3BSV5_HEBCY|nr:hypothetical protein M413DRAFT_32757 [Hebeloma cylindrosporum h7]